MDITADVSGKQIELLPLSSPFPVLRLHRTGTLLYANPASRSLTDFWGCGTDERLLRQILINLLNNAVKYTRQGSITLSVEHTCAPHREEVCIHVEDTGIGVSVHDQEVIFDEFRQASEGYSRAYDGSGLGLSVSQKFAHVLGGRISLQSSVGVGSRFTLHLPPRHP